MFGFKSLALIVFTSSLLALGLQAKDTTAAAIQAMNHTKSSQSSILQNKASRLLSGTVAYGSQYWSYAKVDWMEPIWQSQGKQLYTSLDYMNHLHKSNSHSHELGSGLVLWQPLASGRELGLGAYWLNYNSWHNLRHHGLRLGAKVIWQDWQLTGNGFFKLSKAKAGKPGQRAHPYFDFKDGILVSEQVLNGMDMIIGTKAVGLDWQAMAYHYPKHQLQTSQLLSTGLGLQVQMNILPSTITPTQTVAGLKVTYDKNKKYLFLANITHHSNPTNSLRIHKTDTDQTLFSIVEQRDNSQM